MTRHMFAPVVGNVKREDGVLWRAVELPGDVTWELRAYELVAPTIEVITWQKQGDGDWLALPGSAWAICTRTELAALAKAFPVES